MDLKETLHANVVDAAYESGQPAWITCDCCEEYLCTIHGDHAGECPCPPIDVWAIYGKSPYFDGFLFRESDLLPDPGGYPDIPWPEIDDED